MTREASKAIWVYSPRNWARETSSAKYEAKKLLYWKLRIQRQSMNRKAVMLFQNKKGEAQTKRRKPVKDCLAARVTSAPLFPAGAARPGSSCKSSGLFGRGRYFAIAANSSAPPRHRPRHTALR